MYSDTYEDVRAIPGGGAGRSGGITGRENFRIQNNDCYGVLPVPARLNESNGKRRFGPSAKHFIHISASALILCMLVALITIGVFFSVQFYRLKFQLEKCNENATSKESQCSFSRVVLNNSETILSDIKFLFESLKGHHPLYPASSCASTPSILNSGYYWIQSWNGSVVKVYCDMTRRCGNITGGWMRVALLDMRDNSAQCPPGLCVNTTLPRTCRKCNQVICSSDSFPVYVNYTKVCGKIIGYQIGTLDAFSPRYAKEVDGVKLSHKYPSENIWTFAAALTETYIANKDLLCSCINVSDSMIPASPSEVGSHYFCDSGASNIPDTLEFFKNDPLWDGAGCEGSSTCCSFNNPPWFYRELTASTDDIEMNLCTDELPDNESLGLQVVELYVQ